MRSTNEPNGTRLLRVGNARSVKKKVKKRVKIVHDSNRVKKLSILYFMPLAAHNNARGG